MARGYDTIVIGGGFFGLSIADYLRAQLGQKKVLVLDKEKDVMRRASYNNQARVHGGYHYPRSLLTGLRSQFNFDRFVQDHRPAIVTDFDKYYAVARNFSKVSARQFKLFCDRIGADVQPAPEQVKAMFDKRLVEDVFKVREYAFDADKLKDQLLGRMNEHGVELHTGAAARSVTPGKGGSLLVETEEGGRLEAKQVFNCAYSMINKLNKQSQLPILDLKHELAEMCLVRLPPELQNMSVTVMCGPFFSFMPFPARGLTTLSHVRYTPHSEWHDSEADYRDGHEYLGQVERVSHFPQMLTDVRRYMPLLGKIEHKDSLWEIKTVLPKSEHDDSRPILFRKNHGLAGYHCVMGGKLDNIYDAFRELDVMHA